MLLIPTKIKKSKIAGLGLFSEIDIPKNMCIWQFNEIIDRKISEEDFKKLPPVAQNFLKEYSPYDNGFYDLDGDQMRHSNHSDDANTIYKNNKIYTTRKIKKGEEILTNYNEFDECFRYGDHRFQIKK